MKKLLSLLVIGLAVSWSSNAQVSSGGDPLSFHSHGLLADELTAEVVMDQIDLITIGAEDDAHEANGGAPRYGVHIPTNINLNNSGTWFDLPNGDKVWKLKLTSPGALAISFLYSSFSIPKGGKLFIYNEDRSFWIGGFTDKNNLDGGNYASSLVYGQSVIMELFVPASKVGQANISIEHLVHAYRFVYDYTEEDRGSQSCEVDVNCSEGNAWQDEKKGVVRMSTVSNFGSGWCTASMVNNTNLDCTPYILTAMHCTENSNAGNFNQYTFYFNYESSGCGSGSAPTNQTVVGCTWRADSDDGGGNSGSDYTLLEANIDIPSGYGTYYNGWNANNSGSQSGVGIHHPAGDRKKISTYTSQLTTTGWNGNGVPSHWEVDWIGTANGHGVTEGGSSGSPLFDNQGRIVGTLTGGGSFCFQVPNTSTDSYGKMSYHWGSNPGDDLSDWLDPANTGQLTLGGTYDPCGPTISLDAGISAIVEPNGATCANSITPVVTLTNYGSTTLTTVQINYNIDGGGGQTFNWTGSLGTNQSVDVTLASMAVTSGNHTFNASTNAPNGGVDENNANNANSSSFSVVIADSFIQLLINTDNYGSEITWELENAGGTVLYTGGPYNNNVQIYEELCVEEGACYTFTIFDAEDDGICCGFGQGSYSLADQNDISITTGGEYETSEVTQFCVPEDQPNCDTLTTPAFSAPFYIYSAPNSGYIAGTNGFDDWAKGQAFANNQSATIYGAVFWAAAKNWGSGNSNSELTMNLHDLNGPGTALSGAVNNAPGTILESQNMELERVDTSGFFTYMEFNTPTTVTDDYAIAFNFTSLSTGDEIGLVTTEDGAAGGSELAWEQWSDGDWYTINQAWNTNSDGDFDIAIFPVVCSSLVDIDESDESVTMNVHPNPNSGLFGVTFASNNMEAAQIQVYDVVGQMVSTKSVTGNAGAISFDLRAQSAGVYTVRLVSDNGSVSKRFILH